MEKKNTTIICVIDGGNLVAAYSDNSGVSLTLLDYDNFRQSEEGSEEYLGYQRLENELKADEFDCIW